MAIKTVNKQENGGVEAEHFEVFVDDNSHYMDEDYRYKAGEFLNYDEALTEAKRIVGPFVHCPRQMIRSTLMSMPRSSTPRSIASAISSEPRCAQDG